MKEFLKILRKRWHNDLSDMKSEILEKIEESKQEPSGGVEVSNVMTNLDRNYWEMVRMKDSMIRIMPRRIMRFCIDVTEECNLNCAHCLTFSPCVQKGKAYMMRVEVFENDIRRMSQLFSEEEVQVITLAGGEPLLHPDLIKMMEIVRLYYPKVNLRVVTNGVLLLKEPEKFWTACHCLKVTVEQTVYPINLDFERIKATAANYNVNYVYKDDTGERVKDMMKFPLDVSDMDENTLNRQNERRHFIECWMANACIRLQEGKMYTCSTIPHAHLLNECFGTDLHVTENDYIDIYSVRDKEEIYKFLATPTAFCRYCLPEQITYGHQWRHSDCDINEWSN